jgi:hypothetical protein
MQTIEQDRMRPIARPGGFEVLRGGMLTVDLQVRFNVLRVLPRTGKAVKQFNKF